MHASLPVGSRAAGTRVSCPHITELKNYCANSYYFFSLLLFFIATNTSMKPNARTIFFTKLNHITNYLILHQGDEGI